SPEGPAMAQLDPATHHTAHPIRTPTRTPAAPETTAQTTAAAEAPQEAAASEAASSAAPDAPRPSLTLALTSAATAVALMTYTAPVITLRDVVASLHTPLSAQAWLLNGTPLGLAALLLVAGSLADDYGRRRLFLAGTLALGV